MARFPAVLPPRTVFSPSARDSGIKKADWLSSIALLSASALVLALIYASVVAVGRVVSAQLPVGSLAAATGVSLLTAVGASALASLVGLALALHGPDRRLSLLAMPPALLAVVAMLLQPADDLRPLLIALVQALAIAPLLASRFAPAFVMKHGTLEALSQFEASSHRWKMVGKDVLRRLPVALSLGVSLSLVDVLTPVIVAPDAPSLASFIWRSGLSGELGAALAAALVLALVAVPAARYGKPVRSITSGASLLDGRVVRYAFGALVSGATLLALYTVLTGGMPAIQGADLLGLVAIITGALVATITMTALHDVEGEWPARIGRFIAAVPPVALVLIAAIGLGPFLNEVVLAALLGLVASVPAATTATLRRRLSPGTQEAVQMLGGAPRDIIWHRAGRRFTADALQTLAATLRSGAVAVAAFVSVAQPFSLTLNAAFEPSRAATAALLVTGLALTASWLALRTDLSSEEVSC